MRFEQQWLAQGKAPSAAEYEPLFPAEVPGCLQWDYARANGMENFAFADGVRGFDKIEDYIWRYETRLSYEAQAGQSVFLVAQGIDYAFDIVLDGVTIHSKEGMYTPVELDITNCAKIGSLLEIFIHQRPYREGAIPNGEGCRMAADQCCKPPVTYGWDWNPRLVTSGIWKPCYIETRSKGHITTCEARYMLNADRTCAQVTLVACSQGRVEYALYDPDGLCVYKGSEPKCTVAAPRLWWCNGQGEPALYRWTATGESNSLEGHIGFRTLRIVQNTGAYAPVGYPKTRDPAPITIELNGRRIFAKGSNMVNPELFFGCIRDEVYEPLIAMAKEANMNILRCWGGAGLQQDAFYDQCDRAGILVWQEFMLACNNYIGTPHYLQVLEQEARSIICHLRSHPSIAFWCGGNELFNRWSGMDDQSHALRLLNKLCYELDFDRPFLATAPLWGMAHGGYRFRIDQKDVFTIFQESQCTAYSEFGVPGMADVQSLKEIIPESELFPAGDTPAWRAHFGYGVAGGEAYVCADTLAHYFGEPASLEELVAQSHWLQAEGYKALFEESRRQWPYCSMALNWCFNEPWICAANCSLLTYPANPKPAYYAVKDALRPVMPSARIPKFDWKGGQIFTAQLWYHNETQENVCDRVQVRVRIGQTVYEMLTWDTGSLEPGTNKLGPAINLQLPEKAESNKLILELHSEKGCHSTYALLLRDGKKPVYNFALNQ